MLLLSYLKTGLRSLWRHRVYSTLNVTGLSIGLAGCILVMLHVKAQFSVDAFHTDGDRIYRVVRETRSSSGDRSFQSGASGALAGALKTDFPDVEEAVRFWRWGVTLRTGGSAFRAQMAIADPHVFEFLSLPLLSGRPEEVLASPFSAVVSRQKSLTVFGEADPIGKTIHLEERLFEGDYTITGVMDDPPAESAFDPDVIISTPAASTPLNVWEGWTPMQTFRPVWTLVRLREGADPVELELKLPDFVERHMGSKTRETASYHLQPLERIHLYSRVDYGIGEGSDIRGLQLFVGIALFTLIIACLNFVNLATARWATRSREVGLRKVVGARRPQLVVQFTGEGILVVGFATMLAFLVVEMVKPWFLDLTGGGGGLSPVLEAESLLWIATLASTVGLLAGTYPAIFLSRFDPARVMKSTGGGAGAGGSWLRKGLVVFQFALSVLLILGAGVVYFQHQYMMSKDLGFDEERVIVLPLFVVDLNQKSNRADWLSYRHETVKQAFAKHPNVLSATAYRYPIGSVAGRMRVLRPEGATGGEWQVAMNEIDADFLSTFGLQVVAGRGFRHGDPHDEARLFVINETAARSFGWTEPVGKQIKWPGIDVTGTVIGVIRDFHAEPVREAIRPTVYTYWNRFYYNLGLKVRGEDLPSTLAFLEETWARFLPDKAFQYSFLDESLNGLYRREERFGRIVTVFAGLSVSVACLGLLGLVAFTGERRSREIGVRKVLGASTLSVLYLMSQEFAILVLTGGVLSLPIGYYLAREWLAGFAFHIQVGPALFAGAVATAVLIAAVSVASQALRAALADPARVLRAE